ncbi:MAG: hypothetical protein AAFQ94_18450 [Bacteroidota bacterium]
MKKLLYLSLVILLFARCEQEQDAVEVTPEEDLLRIAQVEAINSVLLDYPDFKNAYITASAQLKSKRGELTGQIDLSRLRHAKGMLLFPKGNEFRTAYEQVESTDSVWQENYDSQIEVLLRVAKSNREITQQFKSEEDIENEIEDILEADKINDFDIQQDVSDKMPINTLWKKVKKLDEEWLNNAGEDLDLSKDPNDRYVDDEHMQLFLNEESAVSLLDTARYFEEDVQVNRSTKDNVGGRTENVGAGCRTWRKSVNDGNNGSRKLKVKVKVRNYVVVKKLKAKIVGWKRKGGKWKRRRFSKTLYMFGNAVIHSASLSDPCDPVFAQAISLSKSKKRRSFSLSRHWWGPTWYVGACRNNFSGAGNVGSLWVYTTIM